MAFHPALVRPHDASRHDTVVESSAARLGFQKAACIGTAPRVWHMELGRARTDDPFGHAYFHGRRSQLLLRRVVSDQNGNSPDRTDFPFHAVPYPDQSA